MKCYVYRQNKHTYTLSPFQSLRSLYNQANLIKTQHLGKTHPDISPILLPTSKGDREWGLLLVKKG